MTLYKNITETGFFYKFDNIIIISCEGNYSLTIMTLIVITIVNANMHA